MGIILNPENNFLYRNEWDINDYSSNEEDKNKLSADKNRIGIVKDNNQDINRIIDQIKATFPNVINPRVQYGENNQIAQATTFVPTNKKNYYRDTNMVYINPKYNFNPESYAYAVLRKDSVNFRRQGDEFINALKKKSDNFNNVKTPFDAYRVLSIMKENENQLANEYFNKDRNSLETIYNSDVFRNKYGQLLRYMYNNDNYRKESFNEYNQGNNKHMDLYKYFVDIYVPKKLSQMSTQEKIEDKNIRNYLSDRFGRTYKY